MKKLYLIILCNVLLVSVIYGEKVDAPTAKKSSHKFLCVQDGRSAGTKEYLDPGSRSEAGSRGV